MKRLLLSAALISALAGAASAQTAGSGMGSTDQTTPAPPPATDQTAPSAAPPADSAAGMGGNTAADVGPGVASGDYPPCVTRAQDHCQVVSGKSGGRHRHHRMASSDAAQSAASSTAPMQPQ